LKESTRKVAEDTLRKKLLSFNTGNNNDCILVKEENLNWLTNTNVGQQCIDKLMLSKMPNDGAKLDVNAVNMLLSFSRNANERCLNISQAIKQRLIQTERQKLNEKWIEYDIVVVVPPGTRLGIGAVLVPMMISPPGLLVKKFLNTSNVSPRDERLIGGSDVITATTATTSGPLENSKVISSNERSVKKVMPGDIIVAINNNRISQNTIPMALMTLTMVSQMSMMNKAAQKMTFRLSRFCPASKELILKAQEIALEPNRLNTFLKSPYILQYSQATQPRKGEEVAYWLLNQNSVISEIFAPFERKDVLEQLFSKHKLTLNGSDGLLQKEFDETNVKKMYDMYTISSILKKFMDAGEVGRGRNKTSLKTAKQVVTAVVSHMKACNIYEQVQQNIGDKNKKRKRDKSTCL